MIPSAGQGVGGYTYGDSSIFLVMRHRPIWFWAMRSQSHIICPALGTCSTSAPKWLSTVNAWVVPKYSLSSRPPPLRHTSEAL
ncbi:hypothetical protein GW17_00048704 [Ensete ventricosum]|nr:hypothetical protein GW17_00048704 [Ensete ventricosum]RZS21972.1 hypothetical protein BHM03_00054701 [Ensete ventricosum]